MLKAAYAPYTLDFLFEARTSRETMHRKSTFFIKVWDESAPEHYGLGECALFRGLSCDDLPDYEEVLLRTCRNIDSIIPEDLRRYPSILFGVETALLDYKHGCVRRPFPSPWSEGDGAININGLVWMGTIDEMKYRIEQKLNEGFRCIKFKIGGRNFEEEFRLLEALRNRFPESELTIRLDANGAFSPVDVFGKLDRLAALQVHSIEQPIKARQLEEMAVVCRNSPIPVALDEELIGVTDTEQKYHLLEKIKPPYIILKPSLCGGFSGAMEWISMANLLGIGWWATSALESNVGLNAIAQWVSTLNVTIPQGLGTGGLYSNNFESPLECHGDKLVYDTSKQWGSLTLQWKS